jgi:hypothetical protein
MCACVEDMFIMSVDFMIFLFVLFLQNEDESSDEDNKYQDDESSDEDMPDEDDDSSDEEEEDTRTNRVLALLQLRR